MNREERIKEFKRSIKTTLPGDNRLTVLLKRNISDYLGDLNISDRDNPVVNLVEQDLSENIHYECYHTLTKGVLDSGIVIYENGYWIPKAELLMIKEAVEYVNNSLTKEGPYNIHLQYGYNDYTLRVQVQATGRSFRAIMDMNEEGRLYTKEIIYV